MPRTTCRWSPRSRSRRPGLTPGRQPSALRGGPAACRPGRPARPRAPARPRRRRPGRARQNDSLARRSRAAVSQPSASARSRSRRSRSRAPASASVVLGRTAASISPPATIDRQVARLGGRLERLGRQLAMERPRPGESLDGRAERLERRTELDGHVDQRLEPVGGRELRRRAGVADLADEVDERRRPRRSASGSRLPHPGPAGDDEQLGVGRPVRQRRPQRLGDERHDRVEQAQVGVEDLDQRPPGRLARLGRRARSSARRTLASSRPQSQYSFQIAS